MNNVAAIVAAEITVVWIAWVVIPITVVNCTEIKLTADQTTNPKGTRHIASSIGIINGGGVLTAHQAANATSAIHITRRVGITNAGGL